MAERVHSLCRVCHMLCPLIIEMEEGRPTKIYGDKDNPIYHGYTCIKGREQLNYLTAESRLLHSVERGDDGGLHRIGVDAAIDKIAARLKQIIDEHGPRAVALYLGTQAAHNLITRNIAVAFMEAMQSPMMFTSLTIDQPGKVIAPALHGIWLAGPCMPEDADVWLLMGTNPIVSQQGGLPINPARGMKIRRTEGRKLIVVDPRVTETAKGADLFLQALPGQDAALLAAMIRVIIDENLFDRDFVDANTSGLELLRQAVAPFDPGSVAQLAGVAEQDIILAARMYAGAERGGVSLGTGPNMSGRANLAEYLALCLMTLCGHWLRAGDVVRNAGVLVRRFPAIAQAFPPYPAWGYGEKLRVKGLANSAAGLPTTGLSDEILLQGPGKVRALISLGGNPMTAWPDQEKTERALKDLDLLVSFDPVVNGTGEFADFVIAPKIFLETSGNTALQESYGILGPGWGYRDPYAQACSALVDPPPGSDLPDDWEVFYGLAQRLGLELKIKSAAVFDPREALTHQLDMYNKPSMDDMWKIVLDGSPVALAEIEPDRPGRLIELPETYVQPAAPDHTGRLQFADQTMLNELRSVLSERPPALGGQDFLLIPCRLSDVHNSSWRSVEKLQRRFKFNPLFLNPEDAERLGVVNGDQVQVTSSIASIRVIVEINASVRAGVAALPPCWGAPPSTPEDPARHGANASRLINADENYDPITGIPRMSAAPVRISKIFVVA